MTRIVLIISTSQELHQSMTNNFNFLIAATGEISRNFLSRSVLDFQMATEWIKKLPYGRNADKKNLTTLFTDGRGTCSTKHAVLKELAIENGFPQIKLMLGLFKMSRHNTPAVAKILIDEHLEYIPEAHNYLKIDNSIIDCTFPHSSESTFVHDLIIEVEINSNQIAEYKINFHKEYLKHWLTTQPDISLSLDQLWLIRERCIAAMGC